jgi:hypothetical protein
METTVLLTNQAYYMRLIYGCGAIYVKRLKRNETAVDIHRLRTDISPLISNGTAGDIDHFYKTEQGTIV